MIPADAWTALKSVSIWANNRFLTKGGFKRTALCFVAVWEKKNGIGRSETNPDPGLRRRGQKHAGAPFGGGHGPSGGASGRLVLAARLGGHGACGVAAHGGKRDREGCVDHRRELRKLAGTAALPRAGRGLFGLFPGRVPGGRAAARIDNARPRAPGYGRGVPGAVRPELSALGVGLPEAGRHTCEGAAGCAPGGEVRHTEKPAGRASAPAAAGGGG